MTAPFATLRALLVGVVLLAVLPALAVLVYSALAEKRAATAGRCGAASRTSFATAAAPPRAPTSAQLRAAPPPASR